MASDPITWPVAISIIGGIAVACVTFVGFLKQVFKKDTSWKDPIDNLNKTVVMLETEVKSLSSKVKDVQNSVADQEGRYVRDLDRIHERLEKVTDLMIDMLRDDGSSHTDRNKK